MQDHVLYVTPPPAPRLANAPQPEGVNRVAADLGYLPVGGARPCCGDRRGD